MIWQPEIECMEPSALRDLQSQRLVKLVQWVYDRVPFYQAAFQQKGLTPSDIRSIDDIQRLPFTKKTDLRDNYPFKLFAVPMSEIAEIHASSGTTGNPTVVAYTKNDIKIWGEVMARALASAGATKDDIVQNAYGYGLFTGGLGVHYGCLELGAAVVPVSSGATKRQLKLMEDFGSTVITCTPSYALFMAEEAVEMGLDPKKFKLKVGIYGAEPWTHNMRKEIEARWNLKAVDIYGLSEIIGPGVGSECSAQAGLHIFEDHFYPEIIDPETCQVLPDGEEGELVLTTLSKRAMPMIRYRTRDITHIITEPCECGRTVRRIARVGRRSDDMFIIRGVNVFPSQIETALLAVEGILPHYRIILTREHGLDQMGVEVEVSAEVFSDQVSAMEQLHKRLSHSIERITGIRAGVRLVEPHTIPRSEGKAKRVWDERKD